MLTRRRPGKDSSGRTALVWRTAPAAQAAASTEDRQPVPRPKSGSYGTSIAVEQRAGDLYERAQKGEDFGQLALTYSKAQTALDRGKLGWGKGAQLPQFIADLVANLQPGQVAEPVRTPTGFHIVRLNDKRGIGSQMMVEQIHARHILMLPNEIQDDATTRQKLAAIRERSS